MSEQATSQQEPSANGQTTEAGSNTKPASGTADTGPEQGATEYWQERARQHEDTVKHLRAEVKELKPKAAELDKRNEADKSEVDKLTDSNNELSSRASTAERDLLRYKAAVKAGVAVEDIETFASRLQGENADELDADAAELKKLFAPNGTQGQQQPQRKPDRSQGAGAGAAGTPAQEFAAFMQNLK